MNARRRYSISDRRLQQILPVLVLLGFAGCRPEASKQQADVQTGLEPVVQIGHSSPVQQMVFSPDNRFVLTTAEGQPHAVLWDAKTGAKLRGFSSKHYGLKPIYCLAGKSLLIGGDVWEVASGTLQHSLVPKGEEPLTMRVSADGQGVILGTRRGDIVSFDLKSGEMIDSFSAEQLSVSDISNGNDSLVDNASQDHRLVAVGLQNDETPLALYQAHHGVASVWNVHTKQKLSEVKHDFGDRGEFSPDARYFVLRYWGDTGSSIDTTHIYETATCEKKVSVDEWFYDRHSVKFTPDGKMCLTGTLQRKATLWDLETGAAVRHFEGHEHPIYGLELLENGTILQTRSYDRACRWDLKSGELLKTFRNPKEADPDVMRYTSNPRQMTVLPAPDGRTFLFGNQICDAETDQKLYALKRPPGPKLSIYDRDKEVALQQAVFSPDSSRLVASFYEPRRSSSAALIDLEKRKYLNQMTADSVDDLHLRFNRDGTRALTTSAGIHRLWDVDKGQLLQTIGTQEPKNTWYSQPPAAFAQNGQFVYTQSPAHAVRFFNAESGEPLHHNPPGVNSTTRQGLVPGPEHRNYYGGHSVIGPDGRFVVSWNRYEQEHQHDLFVWEIESATLVRTLNHETCFPMECSFSPDGNVLSVCCSAPDGRVVMWEMETGEKRSSTQIDPGGRWTNRHSAWFLPDDQHLLINDGNKTLSLYDRKTGELVRQMKDGHITSHGQRDLGLNHDVLISPDSRFVVASYDTQYAIVWDLEDASEKLFIERDLGGMSVRSFFQFSEDGRRLLCRYNPGTIWDLYSNESVSLSERESRQPIPGFVDPRYEPVEKTVRWSSEIEDLLKKMDLEIDDPRATAEFTGDQSRLIIRFADGHFTMWDTASLEQINVCYPLKHGTAWVTLTADGEIRGDSEHVLLRKPETVNVVPVR